MISLDSPFISEGLSDASGGISLGTKKTVSSTKVDSVGEHFLGVLQVKLGIHQLLLRDDDKTR